MDLTLDNAERAGIRSKISCHTENVKNFVPPAEPFVLITNPPYGERMLTVEQAEELYRVMGQAFEPGEGRSYYVISPHEQFERLFGRAASRRRKLYNGNIKCILYMFF